MRTAILSGRLRERLGQVSVAGVCVSQAILVAVHTLKTGQVPDPINTARIFLFLLLTMTRRPSRLVASGWWPRAVTLAAICSPLAFHWEGLRLVPNVLLTGLVLAGGLAMLAGAVALGRSFAILPANRGIAQRGMYRWVRHPMYAGYLLAHAAFLLTFWSVWNAAVYLFADTTLLVRLCYEERLLLEDPAYVRYVHQVRWRLLPGVF